MVVKAFKGRSSRLLRQEFPQLMKLPTLWTHAYFFDPTGKISSAMIQDYILVIGQYLEKRIH